VRVWDCLQGPKSYRARILPTGAEILPTGAEILPTGAGILLRSVDPRFTMQLHVTRLAGENPKHLRMPLTVV
jgi:hypothetical protein